MANHRVAVFTLMGAPVCAIGGHGSSPAQFRYPSGVAITSSLLLVSEYIGGRVQVLSPSGAPLQVLHSPFGGAYVCALGADERRVVVTDSRCRLHVFELLKRGSSSFDEPSDDFGLEAIGGGAVTTRRAGEPEWTGDAAEFVMQPSDAPQHVRCPRKSSEQEEKGTRTGGKRARMCDRRKRVEIALEASDLKEVLHALTQACREGWETGRFTSFCSSPPVDALHLIVRDDLRLVCRMICMHLSRAHMLMRTSTPSFTWCLSRALLMSSWQLTLQGLVALILPLQMFDYRICHGCQATATYRERTEERF